MSAAMNKDTGLDDIIGGRASDPVPPAPPPRHGPDGAPRRVDEVPLHSELVEDVLGTAPRWIVRWGNTLIMLALAALFSLGWVVHYPDVIGASMVVTTSNPPSGVVAQANGDLVKVSAREGDSVRRGDFLAVIRNAADPAAVMQLQALLSKLGNHLDQAVFEQDFPEALSLGEVQTEYSAFLRAYQALQFDLAQDPVGQEIRHLEPQLPGQRQRLSSLQRQRDNFGKQVALSERDVSRANELANLHMMSLRDRDAREREALQTGQGLAGVDVDLAAAQVELDKLEQSLVKLRMQQRQQREDLRLALAQAGKNLRSRIAVWERSYVLRAPIDGRVSLFKVWTEHQFVKTGDNVLTIVPSGAQPMVGRLSMPISNSGKVKVGQRVYVRLENYPWQEFGQLRGVVRSISPVPQEARYAVEVGFPDGLRTSYNKQLTWHQEMQGQASIVVEDLRLIERLFYQLRKLFVGETGV